MRKRCRKSGKVKFDSHEKAIVRAGELMVHPRCAPELKGKTLSTYKCPHCNKWHLTSQPQAIT